MDHTVRIAVVGASGSGKTTLATHLEAIYQNAGLSTVLISQDDFYLPVGQPSSNYDKPEALDLQLLADTLERLYNNEVVEIPIYDFLTHRRTAKTRVVSPADVTIVEGLFLISDQRLVDRFEKSIYLDIDQEICFQRRFDRDQNERGREPNDIIRQYNEQVRPGFENYIAPSQIHATHTLQGNDLPSEDWALSLINK